MTFQFTVSPDFGPEQLPDWHIFNTWLQRQLETGIHFESYNSFDDQRQAVADDKVDIIYANPYDASYLVREEGFVAVASPVKSDETIIAVSTENPVSQVEQLSEGCRIAMTDDPDITLMGMIMLEPANLNDDNTERQCKDNYIQVAKAVIQGDADVGFFLAGVFDNFSSLVKLQLCSLVRSDIQVVCHALLLGPKMADRRSQLLDRLIEMNTAPQMQSLLKNLGFKKWKSVEEEDMEFMIDLMEALSS